MVCVVFLAGCPLLLDLVCGAKLKCENCEYCSVNYLLALSLLSAPSHTHIAKQSAFHGTNTRGHGCLAYLPQGAKTRVHLAGPWPPGAPSNVPWRPLPSVLHKSHAPRRVLEPLQRPLGMAPTADGALHAHLAWLGLGLGLGSGLGLGRGLG